MSEVQVTMPIIDAFMLIPQYSKFLKDAVAAKKKEMEGMVILTHECSAIIQRLVIPKKLEDPGCFTLPCALGPMVFDRCLCDLGASVSLMPLSVAKKLGFTQYKKCRLSLVLADRSVKYPVGILEDLPVMVGNYEIPTDFVVLEMGEEAQDPLILGRPFLATAGAIVNVKEGKIDLHLGKGHVLHFDIKEVMRRPTVQGQVFYIEEMDALADEILEELSLEDPLQHALTVEKEAEVVENLESTAYGMMLDSHQGFFSEDQYEELPQMVHQEVSVTQQEDNQQDDWSELKAPKVELKPLPHGVRYAFLGPNETYPVIVSSELTESELSELLRTLKRFRKAIGYSLDDIKGISPSLCMHRIHLEDESMTSIEHQRRLNPNLKDVVKKEILKLLDAGVIYPISDSKWVSPVHVVPKKGGITVIKNDKDELIPTRTITCHRMCIDYRKLNSASRKDHFPLPFIDQMLERLANHPFYCFLDGYSGFFQIPIHPNDQEKTTFTCPYGTFAYRRMPFGLCNAPATFQRCMMSIFSDLIEDVVEVFMDDFSVYGSSFSACLSNLCRVLQRCEDTNLVLNWEKCHFMVKEGIVLGHKISEKGIEVDKAKIDVMVGLPPPKTVKDIRSFLGHAGFYRRFIKDFSLITRPLTRLLCKEATFSFDVECLQAFKKLKGELVSAPIVQPPDWDFPFEIMCDASDYAVGAVLGQKKDGKTHVIYYASQTLNDAQMRYATTEKEMLAIVFAFEKFRSYLVGSKVIVYTDHAALRHLLAKKDAKPRLLRWILLLQEFDMEIKDKPGVENGVADHLSRLRVESGIPIDEGLPEEQIMAIEAVIAVCETGRKLEEVQATEEKEPWYADLVNYLATGKEPLNLVGYAKKKFYKDVKRYYWDEPYLYILCKDQLYRRVVANEEIDGILAQCHGSSYGGHFATFKTVAKVLQAGFWWPHMFKDTQDFVSKCDSCQRRGNITRFMDLGVFEFDLNWVKMVKKTKGRLEAERQEAESQEFALRGKALTSEPTGSGTQRTVRQQTLAARKSKEHEKRAGKSVPVPTHEEGETESEDEPAPTKKAKMSKGKGVAVDRDRAKTPSVEELYDHLKNGVTWAPTRFADLDLLKELGLESDIEDVTCQFLSSLVVTYHDTAHVRQGWGKIRFKVNGREYNMNFKDIGRVMGFQDLEDHSLPKCENLPTELWKLITGNKHSTGADKNSHIRHPSVRYLHRLLVHAFYPRKQAGTTHLSISMDLRATTSSPMTESFPLELSVMLMTTLVVSRGGTKLRTER
ncbi:uncharacterized protein LOC125585956 [Brassica napus]|uniref:uncharacterized protein LOC125585956 n=1 Tax=Brassica napus TaxID=3708 RepID=UPI002079ABFA|nr:uncharacterized protein LOC125585956 [Brassica napus]